MRQRLVAVAVMACATSGVFGAWAVTSGASTSAQAVSTSAQQALATDSSPQAGESLQDIAGGSVSSAGQCLKAHVASVKHEVSEAGKPLVAVVGASITAGVGATCPTEAWPYLLAEQLGWRLAVRGVPGAGYVHPGKGNGGPFLKELAGLHLLKSDPSIVILQGGHDDSNEPTATLERHVAATVNLVKRDAPHAKLVLLTVFPGGPPTKAELMTNATIVSTARKVDPHVFIVNPIAQHWVYQTIADHLHPTDAGYIWIAQRLERDLRSDGIIPELSKV